MDGAVRVCASIGVRRFACIALWLCGPDGCWRKRTSWRHYIERIERRRQHVAWHWRLLSVVEPRRLVRTDDNRGRVGNRRHSGDGWFRSYRWSCGFGWLDIRDHDGPNVHSGNVGTAGLLLS